MIACVHQPNYMPWLGFFAKIAASDVYIMMDNVQFPRSSVCNRVRVAGNGPRMWLTVPVREPRNLRHTIADKQIDYAQDWSRAHVRTLQARYGRCPHFSEVMASLATVIETRHQHLFELNRELIERVLSLCGIRTAVRLGSSLGAAGQGSALIVGMCKAVGADRYLAGAGAAEYENRALYAAAGMEYARAVYRDEPYRQNTDAGFQSGLSIVDALFNIGSEETRRLMRENLTIETATAATT